MNPDKSSRDEIEVKLTALLLGELPADEAKLLRWTISQDANLQKLHDELESTIVLVREAMHPTMDAPAEKNEALKLSEARREKLLAHFKTPRPQESFWIKRLELPSLIPALVVLAIIALLAAMLLPALTKSKSRAMHTSAMSMAKQKALKEQMRAEDNATVAMSSPATHASVTVAPEPVLAPPPVQIVLPPTESPAQVATITGSGALADTEKRGVISQSIVGYVNAQHNFGAQSTPPADSFAFQTAPVSQPVTVGSSQVGDALKSVNGATDTRFGGAGGGGGGGGSKQNSGGVIGTVNAFAGEGGFRNSGQPVSGAGGTTPSSSSTALAWYGDSANRSRAEGIPSNLGEEYRRNAPAGNATVNFFLGAPGAAGTVPQEKLPDIALNTVARESAVDRKLKLENSDQLLTSGVRGYYDDGVIAGNKAYRAPAREGVDNNGSFDAAMPSAAPAKPGSSPNTVLFAASDFTKRTDELTLLDKSGSTLALDSEKELAAKTDLPRLQNKPVTGMLGAPVATTAPASRRTRAMFDSYDGNTRAPVAFENSLEALPQSGSGALTLNGENSFSGGTAVNAGNLALGAGKDSFQTGLTRDNVAGLRYITATNSVVVPNFESKPASLPVLAESEQQTYFDEKRKLVQMEEMHKLLGAKIQANALDSKIPTTSMVQLTDPAEPNKKQSFWQGLKGEYTSTARIKVERDGGIIQGFNTPASSQFGYDPYFIQTTFETMQSEQVLGKVVDTLKLDTVWAKENDGQKLTRKQAIEQLKSQIELKQIKNTKLVEISVTSGNPDEAAKLANAVSEAYKNYRVENNQQTAAKTIEVLQQQYNEEEKRIREIRAKAESLEPKTTTEPNDQPLPKPSVNAPIPQPEVLCRENNFSTFSLNVSDVSFKLAAASLERGQMPDAASIRSEEFINAFDYRDPEAAAGQPLAFTSERARYPFAQNREILRFSVKTAAAGRPAGRALNLVLLLDNSGSMERADRVAIIREALRVLATQLQPQDTVSVVTFARTARLWADGLPGDKAGETLARIGGITPEGGTNLEEAMRLAYETARRHYLANGVNRVVLLTDGAANLGDVDPGALKQKVEAQRKQGIALDCFGIGQQDYNDELLEQLSSNGDGRYAFLNSPEDASKEFAAKLAGALQIAASDVKVQVEFNPQRVISYRQIGYAKHQLTKEQFRDNTVDAAEIAAQEAGNALYTVETKADGIGPIATVRVRYKVPGTTDYRERSWDVAYAGNATSLEQSSAAMRLAATASAFSEWLATSPFAQEVTPDELLKTLSGVPQIYGVDERPKKLEWMIRQAKSLSGK